MVRDYVRFLPDDADSNAFLSEFQGESERAAAVLAAAYLDELLAGLLRAAMVDDEATLNTPLGDLAVLGDAGGYGSEIWERWTS